MMDKHLFNKSVKIEKITLIFDILAIISYLALFLFLFNLLELPPIVDGSMQLEKLQSMLPIYEFLGNTLDKWQMNSIISILVIFIVVSFPMFVINLKKNTRC